MHLIAAAVVVLAVCAVVVLVSPSRPCPRCSGGGMKGRRRASCGRCGGTGRTFRPGARLIHRGVTAAVRSWRGR